MKGNPVVFIESFVPPGRPHSDSRESIDFTAIPHNKTTLFIEADETGKESIDNKSSQGPVATLVELQRSTAQVGESVAVCYKPCGGNMWEKVICSGFLEYLQNYVTEHCTPHPAN